MFLDSWWPCTFLFYFVEEYMYKGFDRDESALLQYKTHEEICEFSTKRSIEVAKKLRQLQAERNPGGEDYWPWVKTISFCLLLSLDSLLPLLQRTFWGTRTMEPAPGWQSLWCHVRHGGESLKVPMQSRTVRGVWQTCGALWSVCHLCTDRAGAWHLFAWPGDSCRLRSCNRWVCAEYTQD